MAEPVRQVRVDVWSAFFDGPWPEDYWQQQLTLLPHTLQEKLLRYRRWQDRQLGLLGKLLLRVGLENYGFASDCLSRLRWTAEGRPSLPEGPDFNLSHAGCGAVCAFSSHGRIGIDLEMYHLLDPQEFIPVLNQEEMATVRVAEDPSMRLLQLWTAKESTAKAHGLGLGTDFQAMTIDKNHICIEDKGYAVQYLQVASGYLCCLATEKETMNVRVVEFPVGPGS